MYVSLVSLLYCLLLWIVKCMSLVSLLYCLLLWNVKCMCHWSVCCTVCYCGTLNVCVTGQSAVLSVMER